MRKTIGTITTMNRMNSQLTLLHADVERGRDALADEALGHARRTAVSASRRGDDRRRRAAHDARAHEADRGQIRQRRRDRRLVARSAFSTGSASPVSADWLTNRSFAAITRTSAGYHVAGGEIDDVAGHQLVHRDLAPPRRRRAVRRELVAVAFDGGARADERAQRLGALLERDSCAKRSPVLSRTITPMTTTAFMSPVMPETTARVVTRKLNGLANACPSLAYHAGGFSCATSLRPNASRRRSTSSSQRPVRRASSFASAASASIHARCCNRSLAASSRARPDGCRASARRFR